MDFRQETGGGQRLNLMTLLMLSPWISSSSSWSSSSLASPLDILRYGSRQQMWVCVFVKTLSWCGSRSTLWACVCLCEGGDDDDKQSGKAEIAAAIIAQTCGLEIGILCLIRRMEAAGEMERAPTRWGWGRRAIGFSGWKRRLLRFGSRNEWADSLAAPPRTERLLLAQADFLLGEECVAKNAAKTSKSMKISPHLPIASTTISPIKILSSYHRWDWFHFILKPSTLLDLWLHFEPHIGKCASCYPIITAWYYDRLECKRESPTDANIMINIHIYSFVEV